MPPIPEGEATDGGDVDIEIPAELPSSEKDNDTRDAAYADGDDDVAEGQDVRGSLACGGRMHSRVTRLLHACEVPFLCGRRTWRRTSCRRFARRLMLRKSRPTQSCSA